CVCNARTYAFHRHVATGNALCISCRTDRFFLMIPAFLLVLSAAAYRITTGLLIHSGATWLSNFTPLAAIALCSAAYFPNKYKFSVPLLTLFISDAVINFRYGAPLLDSQIIVRYVALAAVGCAGLFLQNRKSLKTLLPASIVGSTFFYAITNAFSWLSDPGYTKNLGGLIQALTTGLSSYSATPSWMFFRNSLISDLLFTLLFVLSINLGRSAEGSRARAAVPRAA
ncbi:MAG: hypothetical protein J2P56_02365, partial [Verrucomicrobia bacterium]|nr:hypothetical protein [Verrucomicrobiota bacterium]